MSSFGCVLPPVRKMDVMNGLRPVLASEAELGGRLEFFQWQHVGSRFHRLSTLQDMRRYPTLREVFFKFSHLF